MANQEHMDILFQGLEAWQILRWKHPEIRPDLRNATFSHAILYSANLTNAQLSGASLNKADLSGAVFNATTLTNALLNEATLGWTLFVNVDLSGTRGLETIKHEGPSSLGFI